MLRRGIPFEVVPGISSAIAAPAYAGIPLTDRRHSASFVVVTGHKDPTRVSRDTRWSALAEAADTLVILMGMKALPEIVRRLLENGFDEQTPAAIIMNGTRTDQKVVEAPLKDLVVRSEEFRMASPAAVIIGNVVQLREQLDWFVPGPACGAEGSDDPRHFSGGPNSDGAPGRRRAAGLDSPGSDRGTFRLGAS